MNVVLKRKIYKSFIVINITDLVNGCNFTIYVFNKIVFNLIVIKMEEMTRIIPNKIIRNAGFTISAKL
jgi:hypothetical protein